MVKPFRPWRDAPRQRWWWPGLCASVPAAMLWIVARLPAGVLDGLLEGVLQGVLEGGVHSLPMLLNHIGDTLFVAGWLASALWLWLDHAHSGAHPAAHPVTPSATPSAVPSAVPSAAHPTALPSGPPDAGRGAASTGPAPTAAAPGPHPRSH